MPNTLKLRIVYHAVYQFFLKYPLEWSEQLNLLNAHLCSYFQVIQEQKRAYFEKKLSGIDEKTTEIDENDDECYDTPQIFLHQLFKLYEKGLIDDRNIRDQVFLMVGAAVFFTLDSMPLIKTLIIVAHILSVILDICRQ